MPLYSKLVIVCLLLVLPLQASDAGDDESRLDRFGFYFENDVYSSTDDGYSAGERLSWLYFVPQERYPIYDILFLDFGKTNSYFTFALTNQIFTPTDTQTVELIVDDRPYAGWTYLEAGIHKSSSKHLVSFLIKIGVIGEASFSEELQNSIHKVIGNRTVKGWHNQLNNEVGINAKVTHKLLFETKSLDRFGISFVPFVSGEFGNIAINTTVGASWRFGYNIPKDFGVSSIDIGADPGIPIYGEHRYSKNNPISFSFNVLAAGSAVARDAFLDGNMFSSSHSVDKKSLVGYVGFGFTFRYDRFLFDFIEVHNSKKFKKERRGHGVGTMIFSWLF